jgi:hypothetical protein
MRLLSKREVGPPQAVAIEKRGMALLMWLLLKRERRRGLAPPRAITVKKRGCVVAVEKREKRREEGLACHCCRKEGEEGSAKAIDF